MRGPLRGGFVSSLISAGRALHEALAGVRVTSRKTPLAPRQVASVRKALLSELAQRLPAAMSDAIKADLDSGALERCVTTAIAEARSDGVRGDDVPLAAVMSVLLAYTAQVKATLADAASRESG